MGMVEENKTAPKIWLAPMLGFTEYKFRNVYARHFQGIDLAISPFITLVMGKRVKYSHLKDLWPENNIGQTIVPQVIGNEKDEFVLMANQLYDMGFKSINWNLGCPVHRVARKKRGSGMLPYPELINEILEYVLSRTPISLSIKMRLGYETPDEIDNLLPILNSYPLDYIVLHPRIGRQLYGGTVDLKKFHEVYPQIRHKIIYNGDIFRKEDYENLNNTYPELHDWMLGRAIFVNPFLPAQMKGIPLPEAEEAREIFAAFHQDLLHTMRTTAKFERNYLNKMKEYWQYFQLMFFHSPEKLHALFRSTDADDFAALAQKIILDSTFTPGVFKDETRSKVH